MSERGSDAVVFTALIGVPQCRQIVSRGPLSAPHAEHFPAITEIPYRSAGLTPHRPQWQHANPQSDISPPLACPLQLIVGGSVMQRQSGIKVDAMPKDPRRQRHQRLSYLRLDEGQNALL